MKLPPLTLISQKIQASEIFPALELIMSHLALDEARAETNSQEKRHRLLPTHLIIAKRNCPQLMVKRLSGRCFEKFGSRIISKIDFPRKSVENAE